MRTLIEVGAFDGTDSLRYHSSGYRVFTFEPKKDLYQALVDKTQHLDNYTVIPKAVCLTDGTTQFNICKSGGASSILPFKSDEELAKHWGGRTDVMYSGESYEVETIRLDTFIEQNGLQDTPIDFLHIDAQGVDLEVLLSAGKYIKNIQVGVLETVINTVKSIYVGQETNSLDNVKKELETNGFKVKHVESNDPTACEYNVHFSR
jgi:FkbM family methyltransferase